MTTDSTVDLDQKRLWQEISDCWEKYIIHNKEILQNSVLRKEIAESWIRSKSRDIDPFKFKFDVIKPEELDKIMRAKSLLLKTALPYIEKIKTLIFSNQSDFIICLQDENGLILHLSGDTNVLKYDREYNIVPGAIFNEEATGTHAGGTCLKLRAPIQITGPENYNYLLRDGSASAAPIFYPNGDLAGSICVATIYDINHVKSHPHTLGLVTSIAWSIQNQLQLEIKNNQLEQTQLKLERKNDELNFINGLLQTTFTVTDVGYITIDANGKILHVNHAASSQLNLEAGEIIGCHYEGILGEQAIIAKVLNDGCEMKDLETCIMTKNIKRNVLLSVQPVFEPGSNVISGIVMSLQPIEKINKLVTSRSGSEAQFTFQDIIGGSAILKKVIERANTLAISPSNILLTGESGTGKEIFAQSIHNESRPNGPFLAINCAALPRSLVESELFGYESGAFTGAEKKGRPGKIELADGGSLFLDEIGDMPLELQPTLLRVLETKKVMRIGGQRYIPVNFRIIAATNQDLLRMVREKKFREDLFFRLSVLTIPLPSLRERKKDIEPLARYFILENCSRMGIPPKELSPEVCEVFQDYTWPGNVRELENTIIYAISVTHNPTITLNELPAKLYDPLKGLTSDSPEDNPAGELLSISEMEKICIQRTMRSTKNDTELASKILGIARTTLYRKLKEYQILE